MDLAVQVKHLRRLRSLCLLIAVIPWEIRGETREEAVRATREGRLEEGITMLRKLVQVRPLDPLAAFDLAVILARNQRRGEAIEAFELAHDAEIPEYVLAPMIKAYRDEKRFGEAEILARQARKRFPEAPLWPALLGLVLTDQKKTSEAMEVLEIWTSSHVDDANLWLALGYAYSTAHDQYGTLRAYGQALRLQPRNTEAANAMAGVLTGLGAPYGAGALLGEVPLELEARQAGLLVRWGKEVTAPGLEHSFDGVDRALRRLDELLAKARGNRDLTTQLRRDRIVALRQRELWEEAAAETEKLRSEGEQIPPYVLEAEADALLTLRRPKEAQERFQEISRADPGLPEPKVGRFFALVEEEKFYHAFDETDALAKGQRPGVRQPEQHLTYPNSAWLDGQILAANARSYADMQAEGWERILPLRDAAPGNSGLRLSTSAIAAARGWSRRSEEEIQIAASLEQENRSVEKALAETAIRRLRWSEARERLARLEEVFPQDTQIKRAFVDLAAHDSWDFYTDSQFHYEPPSTETSVSPGTGVDVVTRLYSPPIEEYWRVIGGIEYHQAKVTEGNAERFREGIGFDLRVPNLTLEGMFWLNQGSLIETGGSAKASWAPTDHWIFRAGAEKFAADIPLRAVLNGITADMVGGGIEYNWSESQAAALSAQWYDFSDGNERSALSLAFARRIVDIPRFDLILRPNLYSSQNERNDGPYYSPLRDFSGSVGLDAQHVIWRKYGRSFGHRLVVTCGEYWQENFGAGWIGSVGYEQVYQNSPWTEIRYGVQGSRRIYDGDVVPSVDFFIRFDVRF